jgi:DNA-binding response OmpR family regulator
MEQPVATVLLTARSLDLYADLRHRLEAAAVRVITAGTARELLDRAGEQGPQVVVLDRDVEPVMTAGLVASLLSFAPRPDVVLVSDEPPGDVETSREGLGLLHYGAKPVDGAALFDVILAALQARGATAAAAPPKRPALILCVDDDALYLSSLTRTLTRQGYRVQACEDAARAMESFAPVRPDLAIVDVMLPGIDGLELAERIRNSTDGRVPILMLSAVDSPAVLREAKARGAWKYLTKPCPNREVLDAVDSVLRDSVERMENKE